MSENKKMLKYAHTETIDDALIKTGDFFSICDNLSSNFQDPSNFCFSINSIIAEEDPPDKEDRFVD
jgi:hypothetical protein